MSRLNNPYPDGPVRPHPRASVLTLHRRNIKAAVRRQIKAMRAEGAKPVFASAPSERDVWLNETAKVSDLRAEAKRLGIAGYGKMKRADLLSAIYNAEAS